MQDLIDFEVRVQNMNDEELINKMGQLIQREKRLGDAILLGLKEIKKRRIFAALGYSSLFEFLNKHYSLSEASCYQRISALKLIEAVSEAEKSLFKGEVSLSNLASAQGLINQVEKQTKRTVSLEEKKELIETIKGKTSKEAQAALLNSTLAANHPKTALPPTIAKPLPLKHTHLQLALDNETMNHLIEIRELLSHKIPSGDYAEIIKYLAQEILQTLRKEKGRIQAKSDADSKRDDAIKTQGAPADCDLGAEAGCDLGAEAGCDLGAEADRDNKNKCNTTTQSFSDEKVQSKVQQVARSRYVPADIKRKLFARAGGQCQFVGVNGKRCSSKHQLEMDHTIPWSKGGKSNLDSMQILCRQHNQFRTKQTHGFFYAKQK